MLKKVLEKTALIAGGLVVGLILAEVAVRVVGPTAPELLLDGAVHYDTSIFEPDPELGMVLKPGAIGRNHTSEYNVTMRINQLGTRGGEIGPKALGELRLLVVGDSFALAGQVEESATFQGRLSGPLAEALGRPVRVINAGVDGYSTRSAIGLASRLIEPAEIDAVLLLFFTGNDFNDNAVRGPATGPLTISFPQPSELGRMVWRSHLARFISAWREAQKLERDPQIGEGFRNELRLFARNDALEDILAGTLKALEAFEQMCRRFDVDCGVALAPPVFVPHRGRAEATFRRFGVDPAEMDLDKPVRMLIRQWPVSLPYVDLAPDLVKAASEENLYFRYDAHWTSEGHRVVAKTLVDFIVLDVLN